MRKEANRISESPIDTATNTRLSHFRCVQLPVTPWTVAHQAPLSMGFPRQEHWSGLLFPSPGGLPNPGIQPVFLALAGGFFISEPSGTPHLSIGYVLTHP